MANSYGNHLTLHIFGGSHDAEIGMTLEGFPKGVRLPEAELLAFMARRAPGQGPWATSRKEPDIPVFTAGVTEEMTEDGRSTSQTALPCGRSSSIRISARETTPPWRMFPAPPMPIMRRE